MTPATMTEKQVVISVCGGVAFVAYASEDVDVEIVDLDDLYDEGKDGAAELARWVNRAKAREPISH